jgi:hypothetical protein
MLMSIDQYLAIQQNLAITIASGPRIFNDIARLSLTFGSDRGLGPKISNDTARFLYGVHGPIVISRDRYSEVLLYTARNLGIWTGDWSDHPVNSSWFAEKTPVIG